MIYKSLLCGVLLTTMTLLAERPTVLEPTSADKSQNDPLILNATSNSGEPNVDADWIDVPGLKTTVTTGSSDSSLLVIAVLSGMQKVEGNGKHRDTRIGLRLLVDGKEVHRGFHEFRGAMVGINGQSKGWSLRDGVLCACVPSAIAGSHNVAVQYFGWDFTAEHHFSAHSSTRRVIAVEVPNGTAVAGLKKDLQTVVESIGENEISRKNDFAKLKDEVIRELKSDVKFRRELIEEMKATSSTE